MIESPRPRLVATDLDGTTVRTDGTLSERTVAAFALVESVGSQLVLVTGRPPRWMAGVARATGHRGLAICANGALVYDLHTERVVESHLMEVAALRQVVNRLRAGFPELVFAAEYEDGLAYERAFHIPAWVADLSGGRVVDGVDLVGRPCSKLLAFHYALDSDALLGQVTKVVGDHATVTYSGGSGLVEISASGVSKASTLARLCERQGIAAAEVVAFGDMPNDLPMLEWAGVAYAVANAHPDVLAAVDHHTASNEDDGVARVLESLFRRD